MDSLKKVMLEFLSYLEKERGFSNHTIKAYQTDLNRFISFLTQEENISNFKAVTRHTIRNYLGREFDQGFSSKTVARRLASIKSLFKYLTSLFISNFAICYPPVVPSTVNVNSSNLVGSALIEKTKLILNVLLFLSSLVPVNSKLSILI